MSVDKRESRVVVTQRQVTQVVSSGTQGPPGGQWANWDEIPDKPSTYPPSAHNHDTSYDPLGAAASAQAAAIAAAALDASTKASAAQSAAILAAAGDATTKANAAQTAAVAAAALDATGKIDALKDGVASDGDTLAKLRALIQGIQTLLTSDNINLDTLQEVVDFVELHQSDLQDLGATKVNISDIINALNDTSSNKPLSAAQGKVLKDALDALTAVVAGKQPAGSYVVEGDARLSDAREWSAATVDQAEAESGTSTTRRAWTAQRVWQAVSTAIAEWWSGTTSVFGRAWVAVADAAAGRTALGLGTIATQNAASVAVGTLSATGQVRSESSVLAASGTPVYLGNTTDASAAEISSPSPSVVKVKTAGLDTLTVSAQTGNTSHTPWNIDTVAGANYQLFKQAGVLKAITGSEASIFGTNPNNYGTYLYESGAEYFIAINGGKVFRATPSGLWGYGDFSLGQAGARVAYLPNDALTYSGRSYANYGMSAHPELVGLSGFNGVGLFAAGGLRSEVTPKGLKVYGSTNVVGGGSKIQRTIYGICSCELSPNEKVNGFKLKTTVPYGDSTFFTIRLHGYDYRAAAPIDLTVSLYNYSLGVIQAGASSAGAWAPIIRAANEGGALVLHFGLQVSDGYYAHFDVDATFFAMPADDPRTEGWTFVDEPMTGTGQVTIPCVNRMANLHLTNLHLTNSAFIAGKLNIGTTLVPTASVNLLVPHGLQSYNTSGGGFAALAKAGGGVDLYTYTGIVGEESYAVAASVDSAGLTARSSIRVSGGVGTLAAPAYTTLDFLGLAGRRTGVIRSSDRSGSAGAGGGLEFLVNADMSEDVLTLAATFDTSGNLGLGITPSAWVGFKAYQAIGGAIASGTGLYNNLLVASNAYYNGSGYTYIGNEPATLYRQLTGVHAWYSASAGNAGDPISFTQAMTLDAAGVLTLAALPANDFPNDAAAAADGIPIGGLYHTAGTVKVRLS